MTGPGRGHLVVDVGGTTLRVGRYDGARGSLSIVRRVPVEGMARHPRDPVATLQQRVLDQIIDAVAAELDARPADGVGVAFAGPIDEAGVVLQAPTVWGGPAEPFPLLALLQEHLGRPVAVVNDLTAAVWRYARPDTEPFLLITVSSGIGNKVYRHGEVLLDPGGHGGELGHWRCSSSAYAPLCDCGERGHLGAVASGRGVLREARRAAVVDPVGYRASGLARSCGPAAEDIDNPRLAAAIRDGDPFAIGVLRTGLLHLAQAITAVSTAIGVRRVVVIGGFAVAIGPRYAELLSQEVRRLGCFNLGPDDLDSMITMGAADDDHSLIGLGRLLDRRPGTAHPGPGAMGTAVPIGQPA